MSADTWVEDENHQTINGERWVARECKTGTCHSGVMPDCEFLEERSCGKITLQGCCVGRFRSDGHSVRWYRLGSPALTFFDGPKEEPKPVTDPVRPLSEICMDGIRSWLRTLFQDRDRRAVEALRDSQAASLDVRVQAALDAMLTVPDRFAEPAPTPAPAYEDDVEIIIDPTPEQVPEGSVWGAFWNDLDHFTESNTGAILKTWVGDMMWKRFAIVAHGHLAPTDAENDCGLNRFRNQALHLTLIAAA